MPSFYLKHLLRVVKKTSLTAFFSPSKYCKSFCDRIKNILLRTGWLIFFSLSSCGGDSAQPVIDVPIEGRVQLRGKMVGGANVHIYDVEQGYDEAIYPLEGSVLTGSGCTGTNALGSITIAGGQLNIKEDALYLIEVGADPDETQKLCSDDAVKIQAKLHALVQGKYLKNKSQWQVTILSEMLYARVRPLLLANMPKDSIIETLNGLAKDLLTEDISGDNEIDYYDILLWTPDKQDMLTVNLTYLEALTEQTIFKQGSENNHKSNTQRENSNIHQDFLDLLLKQNRAKINYESTQEQMDFSAFVDKLPEDDDSNFFSFITKNNSSRVFAITENEKIGYLATQRGIEIYGIEKKLNPEFKGLELNGTAIYDLKVKGDRLLVASDEEGICLFNIRSPERPEKLQCTGESSEGLYYSADFTDNYIYALKASGYPYRLSKGLGYSVFPTEFEYASFLTRAAIEKNGSTDCVWNTLDERYLIKPRSSIEIFSIDEKPDDGFGTFIEIELSQGFSELFDNKIKNGPKANKIILQESDGYAFILTEDSLHVFDITPVEQDQDDEDIFYIGPIETNGGESGWMNTDIAIHENHLYIGSAKIIDNDRIPAASIVGNTASINLENAFSGAGKVSVYEMSDVFNAVLPLTAKVRTLGAVSSINISGGKVFISENTAAISPRPPIIPLALPVSGALSIYNTNQILESYPNEPESLNRYKFPRVVSSTQTGIYTYLSGNGLSAVRLGEDNQIISRDPMRCGRTEESMCQKSFHLSNTEFTPPLSYRRNLSVDVLNMQGKLGSLIEKFLSTPKLDSFFSWIAERACDQPIILLGIQIDIKKMVDRFLDENIPDKQDFDNLLNSLFVPTAEKSNNLGSEVIGADAGRNGQSSPEVAGTMSDAKLFTGSKSDNNSSNIDANFETYKFRNYMGATLIEGKLKLLNANLEDQKITACNIPPQIPSEEPVEITESDCILKELHTEETNISASNFLGLGFHISDNHIYVETPEDPPLKRFTVSNFGFSEEEVLPLSLPAGVKADAILEEEDIIYVLSSIKQSERELYVYSKNDQNNSKDPIQLSESKCNSPLQESIGQFFWLRPSLIKYNDQLIINTNYCIHSVHISENLKVEDPQDWLSAEDLGGLSSVFSDVAVDVENGYLFVANLVNKIDVYKISENQKPEYLYFYPVDSSLATTSLVYQQGTLTALMANPDSQRPWNITTFKTPVVSNLP